MFTGPSVGDVGPGAPVVVHTHWTEYLCTFDMEPCRGHGKLYYNTLVTSFERNLSVLYQNWSGLTSSEPNEGSDGGGGCGGGGNAVARPGQPCFAMPPPPSSGTPTPSFGTPTPSFGTGFLLGK